MPPHKVDLKSSLKNIVLLILHSLFTLYFTGDGKFNYFQNHIELQYELDKNMHDFDSHIMHRLHHTEEYLPKKLIIKNYVPKCGHVLPLTTQSYFKL